MKRIRLIAAAFLMLACGTVAAAPPKVIAHRGHWKPAGAAQNSIRSLVKADSVGCHASEFDVWMTADGVLVVNHDPTVNGVHIETSPSEWVLAQKLPNGENVPTLDSYLATASKLNTRLVCEMKDHIGRIHEAAAVKSILALVDKHGLQDRIEYITFSPEGFRNFIKLAPKGTGVYYLEGDYIPAQIKYMGGTGIDYYIEDMKKHPEWVRECHELGLLVNVWTVDSESDMKWCIDHDVDFITTNEPELLQGLLTTYKPGKK